MLLMSLFSLVTCGYAMRFGGGDDGDVVAVAPATNSLEMFGESSPPRWLTKRGVVTDIYSVPREVVEPPYRGKRDAKRTQPIYPSAAQEGGVPLTVAREPPLKRFANDYYLQRLYNVYDNDW